MCDFDRSKIFIIGEKCGCDPALEVAAKHDFAMLVMINMQFLKLEQIIYTHGLVSDKKKEDFRKVDDVVAPILVIHGAKNDTSSLKTAKTFEEYAKSSNKKVFLDIRKLKGENDLHLEADIISPIIAFSKLHSELSLGNLTLKEEQGLE